MEKLNLICFFAHPDDETILTGGTLAMLAANGVNVHYVCATRGEGGELGDPPVERERLGEVREQELVCAVSKLGGKSLTFLGYVDPTVGPGEELFAFEGNPTMLAGQIAASIRQHQAGIVLSHGSNGEYGHPAHVLMHAMVRVAVETFGRSTNASAALPGNAPAAVPGGVAFTGSKPLFYTFAASYPDHPYPRLTNPDDEAHLIVDVSPYLDQKEAAALCHKTQNPLFIRRRSEQAGRQLTVREALLTTEGLRRQWPVVDGTPDDPLARLLRSLGKNLES